jgi:biotin operon repressor
MTVLAVSADTPPGQPIGACKRVAITLTFDHTNDVETLRHGTAVLRRNKIQRLTREAQEQVALLTQEDLARLLCTSRSTIKRDIAWLRGEGIDVPTRGHIKDIGKGISQKGGALSPRAIQDRIAIYARKTGLEDVTAHTLRHTFAHNLVDAGVSLDRVAMLLGHESLDTTARYTRPGERDLAEAVSRVEWE